MNTLRIINEVYFTFTYTENNYETKLKVSLYLTRNVQTEDGS